MKLSRLLTYGLCGMIAGLLIENTAMAVKQKVKDKGHTLKKKSAKVFDRHQ